MKKWKQLMWFNLMIFCLLCTVSCKDRRNCKQIKGSLNSVIADIRCDKLYDEARRIGEETGVCYIGENLWSPFIEGPGDPDPEKCRAIWAKASKQCDDLPYDPTSMQPLSGSTFYKNGQLVSKNGEFVCPPLNDEKQKHPIAKQSQERKEPMDLLVKKEKALMTVAKKAELEGQTQPPQITVCDRTEQIKQAILTKVSKIDCNQMTAQELKAIVFLNLQKKSITEIKAIDFHGLTALEQLFLNHNQISFLPTGVFKDLSALRWLILDNNQLLSLPLGTFRGLSALQGLVLNNNQISSFSVGAFQSLSTLKWLFLNKNKIPDLPIGGFEGLSNLEWLVLNNNQISSFSVGSFQGLSTLQELQLNYNQVSFLPAGGFQGLSTLQELQLNYNQISSVVIGAFQGLRTLQTLHLKYNRISSLPNGIFNDLNSVKLISLLGSSLNDTEKERIKNKMNDTIITFK